MIGGYAVAPSARLFWPAAASLVVFGLILRSLGAEGDLWEDEITTLKIAGMANSPLAVFMLPHDNNHFLNTLYVYLIGTDASSVALSDRLRM